MVHRIGPDGQVVIPEELRDLLCLHPGARVELRVEGRSLVVTPHRNAVARRGAFAGVPLTEELEADRRSEPR